MSDSSFAAADSAAPATTVPTNHPYAQAYKLWAADPSNSSIVARDNCTMVTDKYLAFYGHGTKQFANWASNWSPHSVKDTVGDLVVTLPDGRQLQSAGRQFRTTEHAMMWYKAMAFDPSNATILGKILGATTPATVKKLGRQVQNYNDQTWAAIRLQVMIHILRQKAAQHPQPIGDELRRSHGLYIMEASRWDNIWGIGMYPKAAISALESGKLTVDAIEANPQRNLLGKAWMAVRRELMD